MPAHDAGLWCRSTVPICMVQLGTCSKAQCATAWRSKAIMLYYASL
jgi:uncharacterized membrane protein